MVVTVGFIDGEPVPVIVGGSRVGLRVDALQRREPAVKIPALGIPLHGRIRQQHIVGQESHPDGSRCAALGLGQDRVACLILVRLQQVDDKAAATLGAVAGGYTQGVIPAGGNHPEIQIDIIALVDPGITLGQVGIGQLAVTLELGNILQRTAGHPALLHQLIIAGIVGGHDPVNAVGGGNRGQIAHFLQIGILLLLAEIHFVGEFAGNVIGRAAFCKLDIGCHQNGVAAADGHLDPGGCRVAGQHQPGIGGHDDHRHRQDQRQGHGY